MAKASKATARPPKRERRPRRLVASARLDPEHYAEIAREADRNALTVSEEIGRRLDGYKGYVEKLGQLHQFSLEVLRSDVEGFNKALEERGYTRIAGPAGVAWIEPATRKTDSRIPDILVLYPNLEAAIHNTINEAIWRALDPKAPKDLRPAPFVSQRRPRSKGQKPD